MCWVVQPLFTSYSQTGVDNREVTENYFHRRTQLREFFLAFCCCEFNIYVCHGSFFIGLF